MTKREPSEENMDCLINHNENAKGFAFGVFFVTFAFS